MTFQAYKEQRFSRDNEDLIWTCNSLIRQFQGEGYTLSVRQLYYQLVARDVVPNTLQSYKRVADVLNNARMAGMVRWDAIEDRTREFVTKTRWTSPRQIIQASYDSFHMDMWTNQSTRVFVIVEKEALVGVLERPCYKMDVPLLAARGYPSSSVLREFAVERIMPALYTGQNVQILHLGDHDPSGIDMTRDLDEKLNLFSETDVHHYDGWLDIQRIALTMDQIDDQRPPPNPAKSTDSRFNDYKKKFGTSSWELDALAPSFIDALVTDHIEDHIDEDALDERRKEVEGYRAEIKALIATVSGEPE